MFRGKATGAAAKDSIGVVNRTYTFVREYGNPPLDRLGLEQQGMVAAVNVEDSLVLQYVDVPGGTRLLVGELSKIPLIEVMASLRKWAVDSPLRKVEFPFRERIISVMCGHQLAEKAIRRKAKFPLWEKVTSEPLPKITPAECFFQFRTDVWVNPENKTPRWLSLAAASSVSVSARIEIRRAVIRCMEAMLTIGEEYYSKKEQKPTQNC